MSDNYKYYYEGAENYCYPNTNVLINKFGIKDIRKLENLERKISTVKAVEFLRTNTSQDLDFKHICSIHKFLFEDLYEWAGKIRDGDFMFKGDSMFYRACFIESGFNEMYLKLEKESFLKNLDKDSFCKRLAYYIGYLNALHPFREGNGRTMRLYFQQLAEQAGYDMQFAKTTKEKLLEADISAFNTDYEPMTELLKRIVTKQ